MNIVNNLNDKNKARIYVTIQWCFISLNKCMVGICKRLAINMYYNEPDRNRDN